MLASHRLLVVDDDPAIQLAMQDYDGLAVVDYVRAHCPGTRLVLLTARGSAALAHQVWARGVAMFLYKPQPLAAVAHILGLLLRSAL